MCSLTLTQDIIFTNKNMNDVTKTVLKETTKLSPAEKKELRNVTKAYSSEEYETIIKDIPDEYIWVELIRRYNEMTKSVDSVADVLGITLDNITLISAKTWQEIRVKYDDLKEKFGKIRKITGVISE